MTLCVFPINCIVSDLFTSNEIGIKLSCVVGIRYVTYKYKCFVSICVYLWFLKRGQFIDVVHNLYPVSILITYYNVYV